MSNDGGLVATLEQWIADTLTALIDSGADVFKTAEVWKHQLESGVESFRQFEPFAFVSYWPADAAREGDYDLRQVLRFSILIGIESNTAGVARTGDASHLGASKIRDLVITALDGVHPGEGFDCDELFYSGETELVDSPKRYALEMHFQANRLGP